MQATFHNYSGLDVSLEQPPTAEDRRRLRRLPLFAGADDATVQDLLARTPINVVQRHQLAVREGAIPSSVMAVLSGRLALSTQIAGEQPVVIGIVGREELIMPGAAIVASPYPLSGRAIEETRIAVVPLADLWAAAERDRGFAMDLARLASGEWQALLAMLKDYRLRSAPQRFAAYLVRLAKEAGLGETGPVEIELADDRKTLASLLGMTPENLSRTIAQFRERGVLVTGRMVKITDVAALGAFAGV
ncbi:Crp/Fnr family transcriptional regulator [Dongia sedimenti]|uniref:Helix-turn-helix domain-containing protein n=1 Tax=Dongia sedimenti TaxID=3064282 RepID=A0ABU0YNC3_9PROT|nr:helix-turn-helix domain-containing protein [Rhodospirillaceae bacterium R-7]